MAQKGRPRFEDITVEEVVRRVNAGETYQSIADDLRVCSDTIRRRAAAGGAYSCRRWRYVHDRMTNEEAVDYIQDRITKKYGGMRQDFMQLALHALKRQVPKKPYRNGLYHCPACRYTLDHYIADKYCYHCGQAISWHDEGGGDSHD